MTKTASKMSVDSTTLNFGDIPKDCIDFSVFDNEEFDATFCKIFRANPDKKQCNTCYLNYAKLVYAIAHKYRINRDNILDVTLEAMQWNIKESYRTIKDSFRNCTRFETEGHANINEAVQCSQCVTFTLKCLPDVLRFMYQATFHPPLEFCLIGSIFHYHVFKMLYECKFNCLPPQLTLIDGY